VDAKWLYIYVNICNGYFAMVGWYRMGPDISVMKARWQAVSILHSLGNMKTAVCCHCQKTSTLTEPGSVENLKTSTLVFK
jgi:hypothetical protein